MICLKSHFLLSCLENSGSVPDGYNNFTEYAGQKRRDFPPDVSNQLWMGVVEGFLDILTVLALV